MKKNLLVLYALILSINAFAQPFQIGHTTVTFTDTSRSNRNIPTEIYYPADVTGNNVPVTIANNDKFPVLSFGHGFVMTWDAYQNIWEALVPEGFIIAFPKTEGGLAPSHTEFAKDIAFVISEMTALGLDSASLFNNRIDTMNCVMGHSMGGGASFLSVALNAAIKTLATLAPAETNPSAIQSAAGITIPALIFAGGNDCVTPPATNQVPMYDSLQSPCKTFISINGGSHCQMADYNFLCSFGEATCNPQPTITRPEQHVVINRYLLPWLKYELKGDCSAGAQFDLLIATDTTIAYQKTCVLCNTTFVNENKSNISLEIFPNPFSDVIFIQSNKLVNALVTVDLYSMDARKIFSQNFAQVKAGEKLKLDLKEKLATGIYLLNITVDGQRIVCKVIRQ